MSYPGHGADGAACPVSTIHHGRVEPNAARCVQHRATTRVEDRVIFEHIHGREGGIECRTASPQHRRAGPECGLQPRVARRTRIRTQLVRVDVPRTAVDGKRPCHRSNAFTGMANLSI